MEKRRQQIQEYLRERINPILQPLTIALTKSRPLDIANFSINWLKSQNFEKLKNGYQLQASEASDGQNDTIDELAFQKKRTSMRQKNRNRSGVSAEVYGSFNKKSILVPIKIQKSQDTKTRILILLRNSLLFKNLDSKDTDIIIDAMKQKICKAGETIIEQGQDGNSLFMVDQGIFECTKNIKGKQVFLQNYCVGQAFGQLALLYNAPRAATIKSKNNGRLFELDRNTFNNIVKQSANKKRLFYEQTLKKVELLDSIDPHERSQICDILKQRVYHAGDLIINQGQVGEHFYIVISGKLIAQRKQSENSQTKIVYHYKQGDYFGEIALVRNIPRQASVRALTEVCLVSIERSAFKRILGSIQQILKRNQERYKKFWKSPIETY